MEKGEWRINTSLDSISTSVQRDFQSLCYLLDLVIISQLVDQLTFKGPTSDCISFFSFAYSLAGRARITLQPTSLRLEFPLHRLIFLFIFSFLRGKDGGRRVLRCGIEYLQKKKEKKNIKSTR